MNSIFLALGLIILIKGVQIFVDAASKTARMLGVPSFLIGLSIVALGTSAPELIIGIISGIEKTNLMTLGDVIGSTIVNISLVLGLTAMIHPLKITPLIANREIPLSVIVKVLLIVMLSTGMLLSSIEAGILLFGFVVFFFFLANKTREIIQLLGVSGLINPIAISSDIALELAFMLLISLMLLMAVRIKPVLTKRTGSIFVSAYLLLIALKIFQITKL